MNRSRLVTAFAAAAFLLGVESATALPVGHTVKKIEVAGTAPNELRAVDVHLWYPADDGAHVRLQVRPPRGVVPSGPAVVALDAELAHEGAAVAAGGPAFPVIVFSHGSVNDPINSAHLLERIAADGFIVAAPTHVTDTQEDVRIEFINTRLGPTLAAQLPIELPLLTGFPARARARTTQARPGWSNATATSSTPWTHCPAGWAPVPT